MKTAIEILRLPAGVIELLMGAIHKRVKQRPINFTQSLTMADGEWHVGCTDARTLAIIHAPNQERRESALGYLSRLREEIDQLQAIVGEPPIDGLHEDDVVEMNERRQKNRELLEEKRVAERDILATIQECGQQQRIEIDLNDYVEEPYFVSCQIVGSKEIVDANRGDAVPQTRYAPMNADDMEKVITAVDGQTRSVIYGRLVANLVARTRTRLMAEAESLGGSYTAEQLDIEDTIDDLVGFVLADGPHDVGSAAEIAGKYQAATEDWTNFILTHNDEMLTAAVADIQELFDVLAITRNGWPEEVATALAENVDPFDDGSEPTPQGVETVELDTLTKRELIALIQAKGLKPPHNATKDELIQFLSENETKD